MPRIDALLEIIVEKGASDLHLAQGNPPLMRLHGHLEPMHVAGIVKPSEAFDDILLEILEPAAKDKFIRTGDVDAAYALGEKARFRVNVFRQQNGIGAVLRRIPTKIITMAELSLPSTLDRLLTMRRGLILVTGPTGSGKSTTLAAILDAINKQRNGHIITIEEPLEFVHSNQKCLITHREVGIHAKSFSDAVRAALRENPDIILVGEMRDLDTMARALGASETGVLVFGTLHTNSAAKTIDRLVDAFPTGDQDMVRGILAENLRAVVAQQLLRHKSGRGRVAAVEVMFGNHAIGNLIREGKTPMLTSTIQSSIGEGMIPMDKALADLVNAAKVNLEDAAAKAIDREYFQKLVKTA